MAMSRNDPPNRRLNPHQTDNKGSASPIIVMQRI
jgi:hypothetical protein